MVKGLSLADFKRSNLWVTLLVVAAVIILLFIPDILGFDTSITQAPTKFSLELPRVAGVKERVLQQDIRLEDVSPDAAKTELDSTLAQRKPLDRVSYLVEQGYIDYMADRSERRDRGWTGTESGLKTSDRPGLHLFEREQEERKESDQQFIPRERVTWDELQGRNAQRLLRAAQGKAAALAGKLDGYYPQSRFAVLNLASGIENVLGDADRTMSAKQAVDYLEQLDLSVTRTMLQEGAPRSEMQAWSGISLAAVLGSRRTDRMKQSSVPVFNPRLTLEKVAIMVPTDAKGQLLPARQTFVQFEGVLFGEELKSATLYRDGLYVCQLPMQKDDRLPGKRRIRIRQIEANGVMEIRVTDKFGESFSQYYDFLRSPGRRPWVFRDMKYWSTYTAASQQSAAALDRQFRHRRQAAEDDGFFASGQADKNFSWWS